jgi:hypothetical protein
MMVELQAFIEFGDNWFGDGPDNHTRAAMVFKPTTINTEYVSWFRRYEIAGDIEFCSVAMVDHGREFVFDVTYEQMRDLLKTGNTIAKAD